jgi:formylglycine-generating enzyme required for sulfatase activity
MNTSLPCSCFSPAPHPITQPPVGSIPSITGWLLGMAVMLGVASVLAGEPGPAGFTNYTQQMPGSAFTFPMVAIPGGTITVGSPASETGRESSDLAPRKITVKPFWIGRFEVSWQEFLPYVFIDKKEVARDVDKLEGIVDYDGISHPTKPYGSVYRERGEKGFPALGMGLPAALEYCRWLTKRTGIKYRLPTEEEWEYACRAGAATAFFWGDNPAQAPEYGWFIDNSLERQAQKESTHPLGKLKPNPFGLYDMAGNVAEWCAPVDKNAPHVARGGAFSEPVNRLRCAARMIETPAWNELDPQSPQSIWWLASADFIGFRLARSLNDAPETTPASSSSR